MFDLKANFDPGDRCGDVLALRMGRSVAGTVRAFTDARVAQMLDHFTQYVGSSPYGSPAVLCGIAHMQTDEGVWYPIGGTRAVPVALAEAGDRARRASCDRAARSTGLEIAERRRRRACTRRGDEIAVDAVVSNWIPSAPTAN